MNAKGEAVRVDARPRVGSATGLGLLYLLYYGSGAAWHPLFNVYLRQIGLSGLQIGVIAGLRPAFMLVAQPMWGIVADLWGRRRTLLVTMFLAALVPLGYGLLTEFQLLVWWTVLYAFVANPVGPIIDSLVLDRLEARKDLSYGHLRLWGAVGWAISSFLVGRAMVGRDLRLVFPVATVLMLLGWLLILRTPDTRGRAALSRTWRDAGRLLTNPRLVLFLALAALLQIGVAPIFTFYSVYMNELGASRKLIGLAYGLQGISEIPLYLSAAAIIRRVGTSRTLTLAFLAFSLRAFFYSSISQPALAAAVEVMHGLSFSLFLVAAVDFVNREVPQAWRATGQSLFWAAYSGAGAILGNAWAGFLYDWVGVRRMYRFSGWLVLGVAITAALTLSRRDQTGLGDRHGG